MLFLHRVKFALVLAFYLSRQVHADLVEEKSGKKSPHVNNCSLQIIPDQYTAYSGPLKIHVACSAPTTLLEDAVDVTLSTADGGNYTESVVRATLERPSGSRSSSRSHLLKVGCEEGRRVISRAGRRYLARTTLRTADGHVTAASSGRFEVTWPTIDVALPESHVALASDLSVRISAKDVACGFSDLFGANGGLVLELFYLGLSPDYTDRLPSTPEPVYSVRLVASSSSSSSSRMTSLEVTIPCQTADQAGFYVASLAYTGENSLPVSLSNRMKATWSPSYNLFPVFPDRATVFPCPAGSHVALRYTQPLCHNAHDKVRLFRQVERVEGSGFASPVDLVYVTERRTDAVGNVVRFPCEVLDPAAVGYCFKYVSTANSGAVRDQRTLCIPGSSSEIDGGWTSWSSWTVCSSSCGRGLQNRHRTCDNPTPSRTGKFCPGSAVESRSCDTVCQGYPPFPEDMEFPTSHCSCGCEIQVESISAGISSSFSSSSHQNCSSETRLWHIRTTRGHVIRLTYDLEVVGHDGSYRRPLVQVRDGSSTLSTMLGQSFDAVLGQTVRSTQPEMLIGLWIPVGDQSEKNYDLRRPITFKASFVVLAVNRTADNNADDTSPSGERWQHPWQTIVTAAGISLGATILVCVVVLVCHRRRMRSGADDAAAAKVVSADRHTCAAANRPWEIAKNSQSPYEMSHFEDHRVFPQRGRSGAASNDTHSTRKSPADFRVVESVTSGSRDHKRQTRKGSSSSSSSPTRANWPDGKSESVKVEASEDQDNANGKVDDNQGTVDDDQTVIAIGKE